MAQIVVLTHELDQFLIQRRFWRRPTSPYLLFDVLNLLKRAGHKYSVVAGARRVSGDIAILHVDCTRVPEEYLALSKEFRASINFGVSRYFQTPRQRRAFDEGCCVERPGHHQV